MWPNSVANTIAIIRASSPIQCVSKKVINFERPIVLRSINLNICMWHISKEQLILFPLVPFLYHVYHAWPSTLPLKMIMSLSTLCKFWELDKRVIAKQCNGVAAENGTSHARRSFSFWKFEHQGTFNFCSWSWGSYGRIWLELMGVWAIIWLWWDRTCRICGHRCQQLAVKSVVDMLKTWMHERTRAENNPINHYQHDQSKVWYFAMVTPNFQMQWLYSPAVFHPN